MKRAIPLLLCAAMLLAACNSVAFTPSPMVAATESPTVEPTATPAATEAPTASPAATAETTAAPTTAPTLSLTSGLPTTREYKPLCIMVENQPPARPQAGLSSADIVYEVLEEGYSMTRYVAVFNDTYPERVGPVRSCRWYYVDIASEYKSLLAFYGGPPDTVGKGAINTKIDSALKAGLIKVGANGLMAKYDSYLPRDPSRGAAPHNVITDANKLATLLTEPVEPVAHFQYDANATYDGDDVTKIEIVYNKSIIDVKYEYDPVAMNYKRWQGKDPMIDANTNQQITVKNIIIQYAKSSPMGNSRGTSLANFTMTGSGNAEIFVAGKHFKATWKRPALQNITIYYDESGKAITLQPGNTWVQVVPSNRKLPVSYS